jgi:lipoate-protein ligase A
VKGVKKALISAFEKNHGYFGEWSFSKAEEEEIALYEKKHSSSDWRLGETPKFDLEWKERFPWGGVQLLLSFEKGKISSVAAFSDAMDTEICLSLKEALLGVEWSDSAIQKALSSSSDPLLREMAFCRFL